MRTTYLSFLIIILAALIYTGCDSVNSPNSNADINSADISTAEAHTGSIVYADANATGADNGSSPADAYDTIQEAVDHANDNDVVMLMSDFTLSSQVTISNPLTIDGSGNTIFASFSKTSNSNNSAIKIGADNVTIQDLTIDGSAGTELHGINVYVSTGVLVSDVSISDNRTGLVVNGSEVTAHNISTAGHAWHGMNVDLGGGVTSPATLTVTGTSSHAETSVPHIWIDDISKEVFVDDVENQYSSEEIDYTYKDNDVTGRAYYLIPVPETKDDCKKGEWEDYGFKNQGQCVRYVNTGKDSR